MTGLAHDLRERERERMDGWMDGGKEEGIRYSLCAAICEECPPEQNYGRAQGNVCTVWGGDRVGSCAKQEECGVYGKVLLPLLKHFMDAINVFHSTWTQMEPRLL
jgi:hypothetical protein